MRELTMREYKKLVKEYGKDLADEIVESRDHGEHYYNILLNKIGVKA